MKQQLITIVPDLSEQYSHTSSNMDDPYVVHKMRGQHAFQVALVQKTITLLKANTSPLTIVDIGDSSGTHILYLQSLYKNIKALSVNLDQIAVDKIKNKGLEAILSPAEKLHTKGIRTDIFLSFKMLEHLFDPINFLHNMAIESKCQFFVITVPMVHKSRVSKHLSGQFQDKGTYAENTHIFELSPKDWDKIFIFSGWRIIYREKYFQYPKYHPLYLTKYIWREIDFDGFYGVTLEKDLTLANKYQDW